MNLFLPGGYSSPANSNNADPAGWGGQGVPLFNSAIYSQYYGNFVNQKDSYNLHFPISPLVSFSVFFGITQYKTSLVYNKALAESGVYVYNEERLALADGILRIFLVNSDGQITNATEAPVYRNTFKTDFVFTDVGKGYQAGNKFKIQWQYSSESNRPFGPCDFNASLGTWGVTLDEPNQSLVSKTFAIGQQINYGPEARAVALANLTEAETINLRAAPNASAAVFCNAEVDEELNLRASINAAATPSANLLGPAPLNAAASAAGSTSANASLIVSMTANAQAAGSARAIPYIGTTILMAASATATAATKPTQNLLVSSRVSGMTIYVNLDTREFVVSPVLIAPISQMYFTRRDIEAIDVKFVRNGEVVELSYGSTGQLGIKSEFDGAALALDSEWSQKGFGSDATYQFSLNLNTQELDDLFVTDEEASISAKVELEWTEGGTINTTLPCAAVILNDVLRGTEGAPTLATSNSFNLSDGSGGVWTVTVDANGILTTTKV